MGNIKFILKRLLRMDYKAMLQKINSIHKKTGKGRLTIFRDMQDCAVKYGAGYMDYDLFEMYNLTPEQRDTYLTRGRNNAIISKYNDPAYGYIFDSKDEFNSRFGEFIKRDWVQMNGTTKRKSWLFCAAMRALWQSPWPAAAARALKSSAPQIFLRLRLATSI